MSDVLKRLGLSVSPGNYQNVGKHIQRLRLSQDHFTGKAHGRSKPGRRETHTLLQKGSGVPSFKLKRRLLQEGLLEERCSKCGMGPEWQGEPLSLQLDHINGDPSDNVLDNLRILCPNCHAQTSTFRGKNLRQSRYAKPPAIPCPHCKGKKNPKATSCAGCYHSRRESAAGWPPPEEVRASIEASSYRAVAKALRVSDSGLRKFLLRNGGLPVPRGRLELPTR